MQISALFDGDQQYEINEVGFWSNDLLLAVLSIPGERLNYKSATASWVEIFTLDISPLPQDAITFTVGVDNANVFITAELATMATAQISNMYRYIKQKFALMDAGLI